MDISSIAVAHSLDCAGMDVTFSLRAFHITIPLMAGVGVERKQFNVWDTGQSGGRWGGGLNSGYTLMFCMELYADILHWARQYVLQRDLYGFFVGALNLGIWMKQR